MPSREAASQGKRLRALMPRHAPSSRRHAPNSTNRRPAPYTTAWAREQYPPGELHDCIWARAFVKGAAKPWMMCTFPKRRDVWVSRRIQDGGCFECDSVEFMLHILQASKRAIDTPLLIDVGANIGMYSLAAAAACFEALAFEPVPINAAKIIASTQRNALHKGCALPLARVQGAGVPGRAHVYSMGASDAFGTFDMGLSDANQGEATHTPVVVEETAVGVHSHTGGSAYNSTGAVTGAGVARLPVGPLSAVLPELRKGRPVFIKMDVECVQHPLLACMQPPRLLSGMVGSLR